MSRYIGSEGVLERMRAGDCPRIAAYGQGGVFDNHDWVMYRSIHALILDGMIIEAWQSVPPRYVLTEKGKAK